MNEYEQCQINESRVEKVPLLDTAGNIFSKLNNQLPSFLLHTFVKRKQSALTSQSNERKLFCNLIFQEMLLSHHSTSTLASQSTHPFHCPCMHLSIPRVLSFVLVY